MNSHEVFIHIHQGCFAGTGAIVRLPQCQWSKPDRYGKISQCITTTKHSKAKTVCIFLGIYCIWPSSRRPFPCVQFIYAMNPFSRLFYFSSYVLHRMFYTEVSHILHCTQLHMYTVKATFSKPLQKIHAVEKTRPLTVQPLLLRKTTWCGSLDNSLYKHMLRWPHWP